MSLGAGVKVGQAGKMTAELRMRGWQRRGGSFEDVELLVATWDPHS